MCSNSAEEVQQIDPGPSVSDVIQPSEDEGQRKGQDEPQKGFKFILIPIKNLF
jgi:hypothetical protein